MQIETEKDLRIKQLRLIVCVVLVIFLIITVYTIYWMIDYNNRYGFYEEVRAEVVEQKRLDGVTYDVLYYTIDGNDYKITSDIKSQNNIGDIITIYCDENNPLGIIYSLDNRKTTLIILDICFGVFSVGLLITYIFIDISNKKSKKNKTA
jgi:hypothetical protein